MRRNFELVTNALTDEYPELVEAFNAGSMHWIVQDPTAGSKYNLCVLALHTEGGRYNLAKWQYGSSGNSLEYFLWREKNKLQQLEAWAVEDQSDYILDARDSRRRLVAQIEELLEEEKGRTKCPRE